MDAPPASPVAEPSESEAEPTAAEVCVCGRVFVTAANFCHNCGTPRPSWAAKRADGVKKADGAQKQGGGGESKKERKEGEKRDRKEKTELEKQLKEEAKRAKKEAKEAEEPKQSSVDDEAGGLRHVMNPGSPMDVHLDLATQTQTDIAAIQIGKMKFMRSLSSYGDFDAVSKQLSAMLKSRHAEKGTIIFKKDDMGDEMFLIRRGEVEIYTSRADKDRLLDMDPIAMLTDSDNFGESVLLVEVRATPLPHTRACTYTHGIGISVYLIFNIDRGCTSACCRAL
jgi:hypothetical protein